MKKLIQFTTADGDDFFVEIEEPVATETVRGYSGQENTRGVLETAKQSFNDALKPLKEISNSIIDSVRQISNAPDEVEVELGLKFSAKAGIILTSLDSEVNFKITLKWQKSKTAS